MSIARKNVYASIPSTTRGKAILMGGDPKGENFLYTCGKSVVIRNIKNPLIADLYDEHQHDPTVARYAPSGFYIASGDSSGVVRIWDTTQAEHMLKFELRVIAGPIRDMAWSPDSKRIVAVGEGRESYGRVFMWDSGSSVGEISGHTKSINTCDMRPERPYRVATGSEDFVVNWYEGPPFKYKAKMTDHTRFVNCLRFSPDGSHLITAGSDKMMFLYDGKTGEKKSELKGHTGGVYCVSWNSDSSKVLTASADRSARIWDVNTGTAVTTFQFGKETDFQQLGCLWQGDYLLSVGLNGHITYLDQNNPSAPQRVLKGHNKFTTSLTYNASQSAFYTASYDSAITKWDESTGENVGIEGKGHSNTIPAMQVQGDSLVTCSMDDSIRVTDVSKTPVAYGADAIKVDSPVADLSSGKSTLTAAVTMKSLVIVKGGQAVSTTAVDFQPMSVAVNVDETVVAVGGDDNKIHLFNVNGDSVSAGAVLEAHRGPVTALDYSPDGQYLASGDKNREVIVWKTADNSKFIGGWVFHTARVQGVAWSPDSVHVASVSQDGNIIVWNVNEKSKRIVFKGAHQMGVNAVTWCNENTIATVGQDATLKTFTVTY